jgi:hypothetical protein
MVDTNTSTWQVLPGVGIGPVRLGMSWEQVLELVGDGPAKPDKLPAAVKFKKFDARVGFNTSSSVDWVDVGGAVLSAAIGDFSVFDNSFASLVAFLRQQDPTLFVDSYAENCASEKLGIASWSNDGETVYAIAVCDPAAYPRTFGHAKPAMS